MKKLHVLNGRSAVAARRALPGIFVLAVACLVLAGCRKEEAKSAVPPSSPESYMKDTAFRKKLRSARVEWAEMADSLAKLEKEMRELEAAKGAAAKDDPAWQSLAARCKDLKQAIKENRRKVLKTVRERISPKKEISK